MALADITRYLKHVAQTEKEPLPAVQASHEAIEFLYGEVLHQKTGKIPWPQPPRLLDQAAGVTAETLRNANRELSCAVDQAVHSISR